ncbi:MAG TPA: hypothetical protein ENJ32_06460 [Crenotrichaceae bacterium]|nr:hypothetical protein [Crenotrichaceae bacterium]
MSGITVYVRPLLIVLKTALYRLAAGVRLVVLSSKYPNLPIGDAKTTAQQVVSLLRCNVDYYSLIVEFTEDR